MPQKPEHKALVDSIIDQEIDTAEFVASIVDALPQSSVMTRMKSATRRIVDLRNQGKINTERAKTLLREAFLGLALVEFTSHVHDIQKLVDTHVEEQHKQISKHGRSLKGVSAIRNADIKGRELERKGALDEKGKLSGR